MGKLEKLTNKRHVFKGGFSTKNPEDMKQLEKLRDEKRKANGTNVMKEIKPAVKKVTKKKVAKPKGIKKKIASILKKKK